MYIEAIIEITGITPLQQSKEYASQVHKEGNEKHDAYEKRTWRNRAHTHADGLMYHPGSSFKRSLVESAKYLGLKIQGQGQKTWTQKFQSAVAVVDDLELGIYADKAEQRGVFGASNGKSGSGTRVWKYFPTLPKWGGTLTVHIYDNIIEQDIFMQHLDAAGKYIGVGTWRPANGGEYGRFTAKLKSWKQIG
jgi:hypothetical protein